MKLGIVTTFSDKGFDEYGKYFVESCKKFVDKNITIYFYTDNKQLEPRDNFVLRNLESSIPDLTEFKKRNGHKQPKKFLYDAVRFSHKSYCIYHAAKNNNVDKLFWLDSDTEIFGNITQEYLNSFLPDDTFTSYLGRPDYSETGFLGFNLNYNHSDDFFNKFKEYYDTDKIYDLKGQLDCHVYDAARIFVEDKFNTKNLNLSPEGVGKHHFNHVFEDHMIHYKGERKQKRDEQLARAIKRKNRKNA